VAPSSRDGGRWRPARRPGTDPVDRSSRKNVGNLMLKYGGGGHEAAGTCQIANDKAGDVLKELIATINADG
jgi:nanoRNase/pAp phosphatase (c-di-AMP/oligoRNAs hydrolase)